MSANLPDTRNMLQGCTPQRERRKSTKRRKGGARQCLVCLWQARLWWSDNYSQLLFSNAAAAQLSDNVKDNLGSCRRLTRNFFWLETNEFCQSLKTILFCRILKLVSFPTSHYFRNWKQGVSRVHLWPIITFNGARYSSVQGAIWW